MNKGILVVYDAEYEFASRLSDYLNGRQDNMFQVYAFTDYQALEEFSRNHKVNVLLVSENVVMEQLDSIGAEQILILSETERYKAISDYKTIEKYQAAENVFREVMEYVLEYRSMPGNVETMLSDTRVIGIYSPVKRCYKTTFALTLSHIFSQNRRVLYINFEEYSGLGKLLKTDYIGDLSDLVYFYIQNPSVLREKMYAIKRAYAGFEYIPPMMFSNDIRNMDMAVWRDFVTRIKEYQDYDVIILDLSNMIPDVIEMLEICDEIYMPVLEDFVSAAKVEEFEQVMKDRHKEEVMCRIKRFKMKGGNYIDAGTYDVGKIIDGKFKDYVQQIIGGMET